MTDSEQHSVDLSSTDGSTTVGEMNVTIYDGRPVLTKEYIRGFLKTNRRHYYETPEANDLLYLHSKGFKEIDCMEMFPELKCLYF